MQEVMTIPDWLQEKKQHAGKLLSSFSKPERDKQEIGLLSLDTFSKTEQQSNEKKGVISLLHVPSGITCFFSNEKKSKEDTALLTYFSKLLDPKESMYHAFHYAHLQNVLFVHVPKGKIISQPLHLKKMLQSNSAIHHVVVLAEPLSSITILDEEYSHAPASGTSGYVSSFVEVVAQEEAEVTYVSLQNYQHHLQHHIQRKATAAKDAKVNWVEAYFGAQYTRSTVTALLEEDGAASTNTTVFFGEGTQKFDIMSRTVQIGKHTFADMNTIGVVADTSRAMCRGLIKIASQSFGSSGHQKN